VSAGDLIIRTRVPDQTFPARSVTVERSYFFPFRQSLGLPYTCPRLALATRHLPPSHQLARILTYRRLGTATMILTRLRSAWLLLQHLASYRTVTSANCDMLGDILSTIGHAYPSGPVLQ